MWELGNYEPLEVEEAVELLAKVKSILPKWCAAKDPARHPCVPGACGSKEKRYKGISQTQASGNRRKMQVYKVP